MNNPPKEQDEVSETYTRPAQESIDFIISIAKDKKNPASGDAQKFLNQEIYHPYVKQKMSNVAEIMLGLLILISIAILIKVFVN